MATIRDRGDLEASAEWDGTKAVRFQIDGNDLVSVVDIDWTSGSARVLVFASTHENADVIFEGHVNVFAHDTNTPDAD